MPPCGHSAVQMVLACLITARFAPASAIGQSISWLMEGRGLPNGIRAANNLEKVESPTISTDWQRSALQSLVSDIAGPQDELAYSQWLHPDDPSCSFRDKSVLPSCMPCTCSQCPCWKASSMHELMLDGFSSARTARVQWSANSTQRVAPHTSSPLTRDSNKIGKILKS